MVQSIAQELSEQHLFLSGFPEPWNTGTNSLSSESVVTPLENPEGDRHGIELPSSCHPRIVSHALLKPLVLVEMRLRKGQAGKSLDDLRTRLITSAVLYHKKREGSGRQATTRANHAIDRQETAIDVAVEDYRRHWNALAALGMSKLDSQYKELKEVDVRTFVVYERDSKLGRSRQTPSWIWGDFSFMQKQSDEVLKTYCNEGLYIHSRYRSCSHYSQYFEHIGSARARWPHGGRRRSSY